MVLIVQCGRHVPVHSVLTQFLRTVTVTYTRYAGITAHEFYSVHYVNCINLYLIYILSFTNLKK